MVETEGSPDDRLREHQVKTRDNIYWAGVKGHQPRASQQPEKDQGGYLTPVTTPTKTSTMFSPTCYMSESLLRKYLHHDYSC